MLFSLVLILTLLGSRITKKKKQICRFAFLMALLTLAVWIGCTTPTIKASPGPLEAVYDAGTDTIFVWGDGTGNLTWVYNNISDPVRLNETSSGIWFLNASLTINGSDTNFEITGADCDEFRVNSFTGNQRIVEWDAGNFTFNNTAVYGYETDGYDFNVTNGRSWLFGSTNSTVFTAHNTTFAYLGNGTLASSTDIRGLYIVHPEGPAYVSNCTFHNSSLVYFRVTYPVNFTDSNFYDMNTNNSLIIYFADPLYASNLLFSNSSALEVSYSDATSIVEDVTFLNQQNDAVTVLGMTHLNNTSFDNITINHCQNNSITVGDNCTNLSFNHIWMNDTGTANYKGFYAVDCAGFTLQNSIFYSINRINLIGATQANIDNCTIYGQLVTTYAFCLGLSSIITNCEVYDVTRIAIWVRGNSLVEDNYVEYADCGVMVWGGQEYAWQPADNVIITNNVLTNLTRTTDALGCGILVNGMVNDSISNVLIEDNVIDAQYRGILLCGGTEDITIRNNEIAISGVSAWEDPDFPPEHGPTRGISITRQLSYSWGYDIMKTYDQNYNITLEGNSYDGTYMQAYVWIDKHTAEPFAAQQNEILGNGVDIEGFSGDHFVFEYTDSYFNGSVIYANPDRPMTRYRKGNGGTSLIWMSLNENVFGQKVYSSGANINWTYYWSYFDCTLVYLQQNDDTLRNMTLQDYGFQRKASVDYEGYDGYELTFEIDAPSGTTSFWEIGSKIFGEPTHVYINDTEDTTHWSFDGSTNTTSLNWTHTSAAEFRMTFLALSPYSPENDDVIITDMEGCGAWVFAEEKHYTFQAEYTDVNGYLDLNTMKIRFSDGDASVIAVYNQNTNEWSLEQGSDIVRLSSGTAVDVDPETLRVTFLIYFENTVLDAYDVDIWMWCDDTSGAVDEWDLIAEDYFNIYNRGGQSTLWTSGNAGRLAGGDVFDLYAYSDSWVEANMTFRNLQHIKMLPTFNFELLDINPSRILTYDFSYCEQETDEWITAIRVKISWWNSSTDPRYSCFRVIWHDSLLHQVKTDYVYFFMYDEAYAETNQTIRFWVDLWINKVNSSSVAGGRINAYYYPIQDNSNTWLRWFTGSNWGLYERRKQSMFATTITDSDGNTVYAQQISLVNIRCRVDQSVVYVTDPLFTVSEYDVFDLSFSGKPFAGIQTPVFDETRMPQLPQGGFLGSLVSWFSGAITWLADNIVYGGLNLWGHFIGFMDTIAAWLGIPNGFSNMIVWLGSLWTWMSSSFGWIISLFTSTFAFLATFMGKLINTTSMAATTFTNMINQFFFMLDTGYGYSVGIYEMLGLVYWIQLFFVLYPIFLLYKWDAEGIDGVLSHIKMVIDIFAFIGSIFIRVIQLTLNIIGRIIESIPVVE